MTTKTTKTSFYRNTVRRLIPVLTILTALTASTAAPCLATPPVGDPPPPAIDIQKLTNGTDHDEAPGSVMQVGQPAVWTYVITNIGSSPLTWVTVADSSNIDVTCLGGETLEAGEMMTCAAYFTVEPGPSRSQGLVAATTSDGYVVDDSDPEYIFGEVAKNLGGTAGISIDKLVDGVDADVAPGPELKAGNSLTWFFVATNTGDVALTNVTVTDSTGADVTCLGSETLQPGESMTCAASAIVAPGPHRSRAYVTSVAPDGSTAEATDPSFHVGI